MGAVRYVKKGERFGRLAVVADRTMAHERVQCRCDCGKEFSVAIDSWGKSRSCGCLTRETTIARSTRHGLTTGGIRKIYWIWSDMVGRCTRPTHTRYASYGGRGITVCDRWMDVANFYADMGDRPAGRSLDRTDNDKGYSPDNCRWATAKEQRANRRPMKRRATCKAGHEYTPENTRITRTKKRACRACGREYARQARMRRAA